MQPARTSTRLAFIVVTFVFFMWGFITVLNDILVPHLKSIFALNYTEIMLIQFCFFGAYFLMSLPSGWVLARIGYRRSIAAGLIVTGVGALLFYPSAALASYPMFLGALFVLASGITLLQVAANPYVSLLGSEANAPSRLNLSQAFNSLGTAIGPKIGGIFILSGAVLSASRVAALSPAARQAYRVAQAQLVQGPYLAIAGTLFVLAIVIYLFRLPEPAITTGETAGAAQHPWRETLRHPQLVFGVVAIFVYVGAEVSIGSFMINYISLPTIGAITQEQAANYVALYWGGAMVGRFIGSALLQLVQAGRLLAIYASVAAALVLATMLSAGHVAMWSVVLIGLFNSIMFPTIFTLGIEKMGVLTDRASSLLIMAIVGGAIVPELQGALADTIGVHRAYVLPLLCYLYIVFYGAIGSRRIVAAANA